MTPRTNYLPDTPMTSGDIPQEAVPFESEYRSYPREKYVPTDVKGAVGFRHIPLYEIVNHRLNKEFFEKYPDDWFDDTKYELDRVYTPKTIWTSIYNYFEYYTNGTQVKVGYQTITSKDDKGVEEVIPIYKERPFSWHSLVAYTGIRIRLFDRWRHASDQLPEGAKVILPPKDPTDVRKITNLCIALQIITEMTDALISARIYDNALAGNYNAKLSARLLGLDMPHSIAVADNTKVNQIIGITVM